MDQVAIPDWVGNKSFYLGVLCLHRFRWNFSSVPFLFDSLWIGMTLLCLCLEGALFFDKWTIWRGFYFLTNGKYSQEYQIRYSVYHTFLVRFMEAVFSFSSLIMSKSRSTHWGVLKALHITSEVVRFLINPKVAHESYCSWPIWAAVESWSVIK